MEVVRSALRGVFSPFRSRPSGTVVGRVAGPNPDPVVLVHGFLDYYGTPWWATMEELLVEAGWPEERVHSVTISRLPGTTIGSPMSYAAKVQETLESAHDAHGQPVDVIGHSMGGLKARWCVEQGDGEEYVDDLVTLGTPHQGTYAAYWALLTPGGRDMIPGSSFVRTLNEGGLAPSVRYTSVWSSADSLVLPQSNAKIPAEIVDEDTENIYCGAKAHISMVHDAEVLGMYAHRLD
jgi:triacylglycerol esterase/lipase EstA (alpha/beta hydrolase family)